MECWHEKRKEKKKEKENRDESKPANGYRVGLTPIPLQAVCNSRVFIDQSVHSGGSTEVQAIVLVRFVPWFAFHQHQP